MDNCQHHKRDNNASRNVMVQKHATHTHTHHTVYPGAFLSPTTKNTHRHTHHVDHVDERHSCCRRGDVVVVAAAVSDRPLPTIQPMEQQQLLVVLSIAAAAFSNNQISEIGTVVVVCALENSSSGSR